MKRVFLIVLDSVGAGALPDAHLFGDVGANTLRSCAESGVLQIPNLLQLGLGNIEGLSFLGTVDAPRAAYGRLQERSLGKDTTIGHWELAGLVSEEPLPTYPDGFPEEILTPFRQATGRQVLCNKPYSGTEVIRDYGREHLESGALIVYTSADSVFQIAAHEDLIPPAQLYEYCLAARRILTGKHGVGRVIARPFAGQWPFIRTANRHDFSLEPHGRTLLDALEGQGKDVLAVGKISDIFAGCGVTESTPTKSNDHGMEVAMTLADRDFEGLCFVNLVEFDSHYGHRQDPAGYAGALNAFDRWLPGFLAKLGEEDAVIITADHGCDPADDSTDHTREYVPLLVFGPGIAPKALGTGTCFCDVAATAAELLGAEYACPGISRAGEITRK